MVDRYKGWLKDHPDHHQPTLRNQPEALASPRVLTLTEVCDNEDIVLSQKRAASDTDGDFIVDDREEESPSDDEYQASDEDSGADGESDHEDAPDLGEGTQDIVRQWLAKQREHHERILSSSSSRIVLKRARRTFENTTSEDEALGVCRPMSPKKRRVLSSASMSSSDINIITPPESPFKKYREIKKSYTY